MNPTTDRVLVYDPNTDSLHMHRIGQSITGLKRRRDFYDDVEVEDSTHPRHQKKALSNLIRKVKKTKEKKNKMTELVKSDDNKIKKDNDNKKKKDGDGR